MNAVILIGRLTRDPDISYSQGENELAIARFTLAVDRRKRNENNTGEQTADFIPCVAFGKRAEFAENYLRQGSKIAVQGRMQSGSYTNKDGQKAYTLNLLVNSIEFAESKSADRPMHNNVDDEGFMNIPDGVDDEGLPFN